MENIKKRNLGFTIEEEMSGSHKFVNDSGPDGQLPFSFRVKWGARDLRKFVDPLAGNDFMTAQFTGTVTIGGLVRKAKCEGVLELRYFSEGKIRYRFNFSHEGRRYLFVGEKTNIKPWNLHKTHTTCYGTVFNADTGERISKSVTKFRLSTLPEFLRSFKLTA